MSPVKISPLLIEDCPAATKASRADDSGEEDDSGIEAPGKSRPDSNAGDKVRLDFHIVDTVHSPFLGILCQGSTFAAGPFAGTSRRPGDGAGDWPVRLSRFTGPGNCSISRIVPQVSKDKVVPQGQEHTRVKTLTARPAADGVLQKEQGDEICGSKPGGSQRRRTAKCTSHG